MQFIRAHLPGGPVWREMVQGVLTTTADQHRPPGPLPSGGGTLLAAAVIVHDAPAQAVLLLQRGPRAKFGRGLWDLPVGKNEAGEPVTATATRELREETGLTVRAEDLHVVHVVHGARGVEAPAGFLTVVFATQRWTGEAVNLEPGKHTCVTWAPITAIPRDCVSGIRHVITSYLRTGATITLDGWRRD